MHTHSRNGKDGNNVSGLDEFLMKPLDNISGEGEQPEVSRLFNHFQSGKVR